MKGSEIKILLCCLVMCVITGLVVTWRINAKEKKIAVVDAVRLFDEYNMKTELEEIAKKQLQSESRQIDSVANALKMAQAANASQEDQGKLEGTYKYMKSKLDEDYAQSNRDINEKVWKRLNPLLQEYGKKNKLHLIIGANGMGTVLYNDDFYDRTKDVIQFVNKRYAEGN